MLKNTSRELKTKCFVLRRTNWAEADRILNLITPEGKISALAKGVRKEKSKLAGGVEMFTLSEINLHLGRSELATVTGVKMIKFYGNILKDLTRMEMAVMILKKVSTASENVDAPEFFEIVNECLAALDAGAEMRLIEAWFLLNMAKTMGEQVNFLTDTDGEKLDASFEYEWDMVEAAFCKKENGRADANLIKILRLLWGSRLADIRRVKNLEKYMADALFVVRAVTAAKV